MNPHGTFLCFTFLKRIKKYSHPYILLIVFYHWNTCLNKSVITTRIINNIILELKFYGLHHYLKSVRNIYVQMTTEMFRLTFHRLINKSYQTGVTNGADLFNLMEHRSSSFFSGVGVAHLTFLEYWFYRPEFVFFSFFVWIWFDWFVVF